MRKPTQLGRPATTLLRLAPEAFLPLLQLFGKSGGEIVGLEDLPKLDFHAAVERRFLEPLNRSLLRWALPEPEAANQLLGFRERAIGNNAFLAVEFDASALLGRIKALDRHKDASFH